MCGKKVIKSNRIRGLVALLVTVVVLGIISCGFAAAASSPSAIITSSAAELELGDSFTLDISISGNPGITSAEFRLNYDQNAFELTGASDKKLLNKYYDKYRSSGSYDSPYYCSWIDSLNMVNNQTNGSLVVLSFRVREDAKAGDYSFEISDGKMYGYNCDLDEVVFAAKNLSIAVKGIDGKDDSKDAQGNQPDDPASDPQDPSDDSSDVSPQKPDNPYGDEDEFSDSNTELTTVKLINGKMFVKWTSAGSADGYEIYRATSGKGTYKLVYTTESPDKISIYNKSVYPGHTYYYKVRAFRNIGDDKKEFTDFSNIKCRKYAWTKTLINESQPALSKAEAVSSTKIKLTWKKVSGVDGYQIYRATSRNGKYSKIYETKSSSTVTFTNSKRTTGKKYYYKIRSYKTIDGKKCHSQWSVVKYATPN